MKVSSERKICTCSWKSKQARLLLHWPQLTKRSAGENQVEAPRSLLRPQRRSLYIHALSSNDIRPGTTIEMDGAPYRVLEFLHVKPGKGAAFVRSKLKNFVTGGVLEKTFRAGENLQAAQIDKRESQFTYQDGDDVVFMDTSTYEETRLKRDESWAKWIKEGDAVALISWNGHVMTVDVPKTVSLAVTTTDPGVKGNTASGGSKPATLETGAVVQVPLFISEGEVIRIDTRTDEYLGRS